MSEPKKKPGNRGGPSPSRHQSQCKLCRHPSKTEIHALYMRGESSYDLAKEYDLSPESIQRHARYFNLAERRIRQGEDILSFYVSRNLDRFLSSESYSPQIFLKAMDMLMTLRGQPRRKSPDDLKRESELYRETIQDLMVNAEMSEDEARNIIIERFPDARKHLMPEI